jgi:hypothetical protein
LRETPLSFETRSHAGAVSLTLPLLMIPSTERPQVLAAGNVLRFGVFRHDAERTSLGEQHLSQSRTFNEHPS